MDAAKLSFLTAVLGADGAQALNKAAQRYAPLESVLVPRAILSWLSIAARTGYEGEIPGVPGSFLTFAKNEADLFAGQLSVNDAVYPFENASFMHVVAGVSVALNADVSADHGIKDSDLVNLGRQVDLLTKAEFVHNFEPLQKGAMQRLAPFNPAQIDPKEMGTVTEWQAVGSQHDRQLIPQASKELMARALHRVSGVTQVKRGEDGQRHFLLHRIMPETEHTRNIDERGYSNAGMRTSWTPHGDWVADRAKKGWLTTKPGTSPKVVSAWVPESNIVHAPWMVGHRYKDDVGPNSWRHEMELIVDQSDGTPFALHSEPLQKAEPARQTVTMYHVGRDFDQFDPKFIGTGEGARSGAINPLGPGLYGTIADPGAEEAAKNVALGYSKYHQDPYLHTFEVDLDPSGTSFGSHNYHTQGFNTDELGNRWEAVGQKLGLRHPDASSVVGRLGHVPANELLRQHGISAKMGTLSGGVHELAVFDPSRLRRVSKVRVADLQNTAQPVQKSESVVAAETPKRKRKVKKGFQFTKSQVESPCADCGCPQVENDEFVGCMCTSELVPYASLTKTHTGYTIEFGPEWGEDELSLLFSITGANNG